MNREKIIEFARQVYDTDFSAAAEERLLRFAALIEAQVHGDSASGDIHSCSYYCTRPECIKAQRDELRDKMESAPASDAESVAWLYDFPNPENRDEVIRNWLTQDPSEIEHAKGFNVRPLYLHPAPAVVRLTDKEIIDLYETSELAGSYFETGTEKAIAVAHAVMKAMEEKAAAKEAGL